MKSASAFCVFFLLCGPAAYAQDAAASSPSPRQADSRGVQVAKFLGGSATGFAAHELAHVLADIAFGADISVKRVDFHGVPFFAITHSPNVSPRQEYVISSAGFWMQHATSEWIMTASPDIRSHPQSFQKGVLAFNVLASVGYAGAALFETGPAERDTRSMAVSLGVSERWIGVMILAPALLDAYRYFHPNAGWARWTSRGVKIGMVLLVLR